MKIQMSVLAKGKVGRMQQFYTLLANVSHHVCGSGLTRADAASSSVRSRAYCSCSEGTGEGRRAKVNRTHLYKSRSHQVHRTTHLMINFHLLTQLCSSCSSSRPSKMWICFSWRRLTGNHYLFTPTPGPVPQSSHCFHCSVKLKAGSRALETTDMIFETVERILKVRMESTAQFKVSLKKKIPTRENLETKLFLLPQQREFQLLFFISCSPASRRVLWNSS